MKLFLKFPPGFNLKQEYDIYNEQEELVYKIRGNSGMLGSKSAVQDAEGNDLLTLKQKIALTTSLDISKDGQKIANIKKKMATLKPILVVDGLDWTVKGNFFNFEYTIFDKNGKEIATLGRSSLAADEFYECQIADESIDPALILAAVAGIDTYRSQR